MGEVRADTIFFGKGSITKDRSLFQKQVVGKQLRRVGVKGTVTGKDSPLERLARDAAAAKIRLERQSSELRQSEKKLEKTENLVGIDPMTGLVNKRAFNEALKTEIEETKRTGIPFTLLYLDLDKFKKINDKFGHAAGDRVIVESAKAYKQVVRPYDVVGRIGGDEFAIILKGNLTPNQLENICQRMRYKFLEYIIKHPQFSDVDASIGAAQCPPDGLITAKALLKRADNAMTHAKIDKVKSVLYWTPGMKRNIVSGTTR